MVRHRVKIASPISGNAAPILGGRQVVVIGGVFLLLLGSAMAAIFFAARLYQSYKGIEPSCANIWPFYMLLPEGRLLEHSPRQMLFVAGLSLLFAAVVRSRERILDGNAAILAVSLLLLLASNAIQGVEYGFHTPVAGGGEKGIQYYHDAMKIASAREFLSDFNRLQPELLCHSRTHPPGAVLVYLGLLRSVGDPRLTSCLIAAMSVVLSGIFLCGFLSRYLDAALSRYVTFLFFMLPSVQIFYCASLDAMIATWLLGVLFFFTHPSEIVAGIGVVICLWLASFLSFGAVFILPVLAAYVVVRRRRRRVALASLSVVAALYAGLFWATGFSYVEAFRTASALENPEGFRLFAKPLHYLFTRAIDVVEIVVFLGPYLLVLGFRGFCQGWRQWRSNELLLLSAAACATLLAMFLAGAFKTGETARACLFIYPYLMFPAAQYLADRNAGNRDKDLLLYLTFGQTLAMQTLGRYFW